MAFFKITLIRSAIGMTSRQNKIVASLGLHKRMSVVYHPVTGDVAGKIMKVKELLAVSEVEEAETKAERRRRRAPERGFEKIEV
jgi:large subunit ribosomal protein L30